MKYLIDTDEGKIHCLPSQGEGRSVEIYSREGFRLISSLWLKQEWNQLHWQTFSWLGFQIWQLPEDLLRLQEVVCSIRPDVILETGVKHGGSAVFFASLCRLLGRGRVISIDINIPDNVRTKVMDSPWGGMITLIEGNAIDPRVVSRVKALIDGNDRVLVFLDSDHTRSHVLGELEAYAELVSPGSYIVATDGVMQSLASTPGGRRGWLEDNPAAAARDFAARNPDFVLERPKALFHDEYLVEELTFWPDAWLKRISPPSPTLPMRDPSTRRT